MKLKVANLIYKYQQADLSNTIDNISFESDENFLIITGSSGSGKTTLLYLLSGLIKANSGDICFDEFNINKVKEKELINFRSNNIGFVFQNYFLDSALSNLENVYLPALISNKYSRKDYINRSKELILKVGLNKEQIKRKPFQLSGGEQQRIAIARALINNPSIIFADEPTGNLDSKTAIEIMNMLKQLSNDGIKIILVTHDQSFYKYGDRIITLKDGKIIKDEKVC